MQNIIERFVSPSGRPVRVVVRDGEPWFVAKDVCDILGTQVGHIRQIVGDKRVSIIHNMNGNHQQMLLVSEAGLYKLILVSRKKGAVAFQDWLTDEVLPSIRKHGAYMTPETARNIIEHPDDAVALAKALLEERERREFAEAERDKAIREKSWIGTKREANALAAASRQYRKVKRLEGELEVARRELDEMLPDAEAHRRWLEAWKNGMNRWHDGMVDPDQTRLWDDDREIFS